MRSKPRQAWTSALASLLLSFVGHSFVHAQTVPGGCGTLRSVGQYGPYDARKDLDRLPIVLGAHFRPHTQALTTIRKIDDGADLDYTLRAIPNYHRALIVLMRFAEREKSPQPPGTRFSVDCYFKRAIAFTPDDAIVRMIYSTYLNSQGNAPEANSQLSVATGYAADNPFTHFNIGLHYFDLKNYDMALVQAHKAMALGWTQVDLRDRLQAVGKWVEPTVLPSPPTVAVSAPDQPAK